MTEAIAREYGDRGIRANLVVAGFVETELSSSLPPAGRRFFYENSSLMRAGEPQEISTAALFLASDRAAAMNGRFVYVAGGVVDITLTSL
jgi:3-oxoacyl-[acyl-carrier protein] reductase